jgi:uncharacterized peroxidase-related enzyme
MAYITIPTPEQLAQPVREALQAAKGKTGEPGEIAYIVALRPDIFAMTMNMVKTLLISETRLPYRIKESIALLISMQNSCDMCVDEHRRIAQVLGMSAAEVERVLGGLDAMHLTDQERTLLAFCLKAGSKDNYKIAAADLDAVRAAGYGDEAILEAVAVVGYFNYINTLSNALGAGK